MLTQETRFFFKRALARVYPMDNDATVEFIDIDMIYIIREIEQTVKYEALNSQNFLNWNTSD